MSFLFGSSSSSSDSDSNNKVVRMPVQSEQDRAAQAEARKRALSRTGRSSTMLTRRSSEAGTQAYGNSLLGQT